MTERKKSGVSFISILYVIVLLDSEHGTWTAYGNNYWPRYYLIDSQGFIRYDHIGEGGYNQIEKSIQSLLAERAASHGRKRNKPRCNSNGANQTRKFVLCRLRAGHNI